MREPSPGPSASQQKTRRGGGPERRICLVAALGAVALLGGCAAQPTRMSAVSRRVYDPKLGVWSSPRLVADGEAVPRGGGSYLTGRPYTIAGRTYVPSQNASGYSAVGMASWYGDAFHGRRTANGEIFDKSSISAAHPTLPLPSYVRVTNLTNGRSMVVRVNDRGPYHGGRVMDVSQRVAEALSFRGEGTARVRIDYIGRAALQGSDDAKLMASLRTDGSPAQMDGMPESGPVAVADAADEGRDQQPPPPPALPAAVRPVEANAVNEEPPVLPSYSRSAFVPLPPPRPFNLDSDEPASPVTRRRGKGQDHLAALIDQPMPSDSIALQRPFDRAATPSPHDVQRGGGWGRGTNAGDR